jgi:ATP-binding cassette, subfamily B, multidrug efflux pump
MTIQSDSRTPTRRSAASQPAFGPPGPGGRKIEKARNPRHALVRLLPYLRPYGWGLTLVTCLVAIDTVLSLFGPYLMGVAIDRYISQKSLDGLGRIALVMLGVYFISNVSQVISNWTMARISQGALKTVRKDLFTHLQVLTLKFFDQNQAGELMSRLTNDIEAINSAVSQNVVSMVASVLSMTGILVAMFLLNSWLALISLFVVPLMLWFANFIARYTRKGFRELQKQLGGLTAIMEESISGQRVVMAFGRKDTVVQSFREHNESVYKAGVYANTYAMLLMPLTNILGNFFVILLVGFGGWLAIQGLVTVGVIATFISYGRNFIQPVRQIAEIYNAIQAALAGAERVFEILDTPPETDQGLDYLALDAVVGKVRFENVTFGYLTENPVIKHMSFTAQAGEMIALVGPTGAGKTTLINLLMRFYETQEGKITIDGKDIRRLKKSELRQKLGIVLQDTFLFSDTVMENIRYGRLEATDEECIEASRLADADHYIRLLPDGYNTVLSERAGNLSQGQRQLLAIARVILADPAILILDEATSSVDTRTEARIQKALLRLMQNRTSFVIAHRLSTIREANHVIVVNHGEIVEQGSHAELIEKRGFYHQLYLAQFKGQVI